MWHCADIGYIPAVKHSLFLPSYVHHAFIHASAWHPVAMVVHLLYPHLLYPHLLYPHLLYPHLLYPHLLYPHLLYPHLLYPHILYPCCCRTTCAHLHYVFIYLLSILFYYLQYLCYDLPLLHAVAGRPAPVYIMYLFIIYFILLSTIFML